LADQLTCMYTAAGIIGAGTNNARLAGLLRSLSAYYAKEPALLFLVRVAQGLVHMGKGLMTLAPAHAHGQLLSGTRSFPAVDCCSMQWAIGVNERSTWARGS